MRISASEEKPTICASTLDGFLIKVDDKKITDNSNQSKEPQCLLKHLVVLQKKDVSPNGLISVIWADGPGVNPQGALKTLMSRSRRLLEPLELPPQKLLVQRRGSYARAQKYPIQLDVDRFEAICTQVVNRVQNEDAALELCLEGPAVYKGDFLPKPEYEPWIIPTSTYCHPLYQKLVYKTADPLLKKENSSLTTSACQTTVEIGPFSEEFHYYLVHSLYGGGYISQAIGGCNHIMDLSYSGFSIPPSDHSKDLYKTIRSKEQGININLGSIQETLRKEASGGASYCEYPVSHDLFRLERRAIERTGNSIYLCLLTVSDLDRHMPKLAVLNKFMEHFSNVVHSSLRCSDVHTHYSISQHIILLLTVTAERGEMVLKRIIPNFHK